VEGGLETGSGVVFGDYIDVAGLPRAERSRLPADAADILSRFQQQQNLATMNAIRELYALEQRYLVQGLPGQAPAIRERIQQLQQTLAAPGVPGSGVLPDPGTLTGHRGQNGTSLVFQVTGDPNAGSVWGSDIYTDDSTLASVVVHAGLLRSGETGNVRVDILAGQESYVGCTKNGVTSSSYQSWQGSYRVSRAAAAAAVPSLGEYRGRNNESLTFDITGDAKAGTVWGGDFNIYTDDSNLATAVVHAGLVKDGEHARVKVTILPGRDQYPAIKRNEIESHPWGSWDGSYRIEAATTNKLDRLTRPRTLRTYGSPPGMTAPSPGMPELSQYRGKGNTTMMVEVTGSTDGVVWGEDVYTDDSSIATAAVHAGVLKAGEKGLIAVTTLPGQKSYKGSEKNGVTTSDYAEWGGSFTLERADGKRLAEPRSKGRTETPKLHSYTFGLER
jgi:hypothetical protein